MGYDALYYAALSGSNRLTQFMASANYNRQTTVNPCDATAINQRSHSIQYFASVGQAFPFAPSDFDALKSPAALRLIVF